MVAVETVIVVVMGLLYTYFSQTAPDLPTSCLHVGALWGGGANTNEDYEDVGFVYNCCAAVGN